jgi:hypothetical protein
VTDHSGKALPRIPVYLNSNPRVTYTDENGFFFFNDLKPGNYWLKTERGINVVFSSTFNLPATPGTNPVRYDLSFPVPAE